MWKEAREMLIGNFLNEPSIGRVKVVNWKENQKLNKKKEQNKKKGWISLSQQTPEFMEEDNPRAR